MKTIKILVLLACFSLSVKAHNIPIKNFLHVGDKMPDIEFSIQKYPKKTVRISDFKNKLLILDFWGVFCGTCISSMPRMEKLQNEFKDQIQIIRVCRDDADKVNKLTKRSEIMQENQLPLVTAESGLAKMFDIPTFPYYVWIEGDGRIKYITDQDVTNPEGIRKYLSKTTMAVEEKKKISYNSEKPMMPQVDPALERPFVAYSYLAPRSKNSKFPATAHFLTLPDGASYASISVGSIDIYRLYAIAYQQHFPANYINVILDFPGADTISIKDHQGHGKQLYDYELALGHPETSDEICRDMQQQLDMYFHLHSSIKPVWVDCYILKKLGTPSLQSKYNTADSVNAVESDIDYLRYRHSSWERFIQNINFRVKSPKIILDGTLNDPKLFFDMDIPKDFSDIKKVREQLKQYGLTIEEDVRELNMVVVKK